MHDPSQPPGGAPGPSGPRAEFWYRVGAYLIDGVVVGIPLNALLLATRTDDLVVRQAVLLVASLLYSVYFLARPSGQTVGMRVLGIRAIAAEPGGLIDYRRATVRYLVSIASGFACAIGYLWMLWDPERQTWQDKVANTFVVPVSAYPVERWPG